jgi:dipeptidase E
MKCFLTSSPMLPDTGYLNPENGFVKNLRASLSSHCRAVFVCSDPGRNDLTDLFAGMTKKSFEDSDFVFSDFVILDDRTLDHAEQLIRGADLVILAGGHVPTQNRFFQRAKLKSLLQSFDGVLIGISAGSMNCSETVYAHPEMDGEAVDPAYKRFLPGLGLTQAMILPHYQILKDDVVDGLRAIEDIAMPDSFGRRFFLLPDGSYLYLENGLERIYGEAYLLADGNLSKISSAEEMVIL